MRGICLSPFFLALTDMAILLTILLSALVQPVTAGVGGTTLCLPGSGTLWFGAHAPVQYHQTEMDLTSSSISSFARTVGKKPAIVTFSHEWGINKSFPERQFSDILQTGATPWVRLMLRSDIRQNRPEPFFTLSRICIGVYDSELRAWGRKVKTLGYPVLVEYGTEVNGKWFSWNGYWTGYEEGAEKFKEAYRHIHRIMDEEQAANLIWVYHVNQNNNPEETWNTYAAYYPGDEYTDVLAVSVYGALSPDSTGVRQFSSMMNESYQELTALNPDKPVIVAEMGTDLRNRETDPVRWTSDAYSALINGTWPRVAGVIWWNSAWPNNGYPAHNTTMRIEESEEMGRVFRSVVGSDQRFLNQTSTLC